MTQEKEITKGYPKDVYLLLAATFFYMAGPMMIVPLIVGFSKNLGATAAMAGIISGLMNICSLICRPLVGNLTDKISKYKFAMIGLSLMFLSSVGYAIATNMVVMVIIRVLNGIGYSCCSVCLSTWIADMLPSDKVSSGMGLYGTVNALSMAIAPAVGVSLCDKVGYRTAFILSAIITIFAFIIVQLVKNRDLPIKSDKKEKIQLVEIKALPITFIIMLFAIPYCATQSFLVSYVSAKDVEVNVSLFFPSYALILLVLRLSLKSKFDKWPFKLFFFSSALCAVISMIGLTFLKSDLTILLAAAFMAGGYGIMCSVCQATAILLAGPGKRGVANSTYYIGLDLGMSFGAMIGGMLYGSVSINYFYPCLMICVPLSIIVFIVWNIIKSKNQAK